MRAPCPLHIKLNTFIFIQNQHLTAIVLPTGAPLIVKEQCAYSLKLLAKDTMPYILLQSLSTYVDQLLPRHQTSGQDGNVLPYMVPRRTHHKDTHKIYRDTDLTPPFKWHTYTWHDFQHCRFSASSTAIYVATCGVSGKLIRLEQKMLLAEDRNRGQNSFPA